MSELNDEILKYIDEQASLDTHEYALKCHFDHQKVIGAVKSLQSSGEGLLNVEQSSFKTFVLNEEAEHIVQHGSHEVVVFSHIPAEGILQSQLMVSTIKSLNNWILFYFTTTTQRIT